VNPRITGIGAVSALGVGVDALWSGALAGQVAIAPRQYGDLEAHVGAAPIDAPDRLYGLAWSAAVEALAGRDADALVVSTTKGGIERGQRYLEGTAPASELLELPLHRLATRLARALRITGPVRTVSVACASGTVALGHALRLVRSGRASRVLVVGADALSAFVVRGFASLRALGDGPARPFDAERSGLSVGEAGAAMVLEAGDGPALATLAGFGAANDANHITGPSRDGAGLVRAWGLALADAGTDRVELVSAHGTGTRYNDAMEGHAFAELGAPVHGLKGAVGHTMGAAGVLEAVLCVQALGAGRCPPTAGLVTPDPEIDLDLVTAARAIDARHVLSASSGFSGINAAVVLCRA
jgi:3-oxoacyl-[acyl-carrier-protein] synthase II